MIVNAAFGEGEKKPEDPREKYNDITAGAATVEEAAARINAMLTFG